jgi:predicted aspartyl protease
MRRNGPWSKFFRRCWFAGALSVSCTFAAATESLPPSPEDAAAGALSAEDSLLAAPTTHDHIGRVVVPVMINGQGPFRFVVDTGASHSTISPTTVTALGLKARQQSVVLDGITGSTAVPAVTVDRLEAGVWTLERTAMPVVWAPVLGGADGILGAAGLSTQSLVVDFQHNRVAIAGHMGLSMRSEAMRVHGVRMADGLMAIKAMVGTVQVRAVIDTGAERSLGNLALREAVISPKMKGAEANLTSVYGATKDVESGELLKVPTISMQSMRIEDVALVFGDFHIFKVWNLEDKPALIIGMDVLGTTASLGIDFKNEDIYLASAATSDASFLRRATGGASNASH